MLKNVKEIWLRAQLVSKKDDFDFKVKSNLDDILKLIVTVTAERRLYFSRLYSI